MSEQCYCLRWNNYQSSVVGDLRSLLEQEEFVDVTIACEGRRIKAHRLMLSACSNYFRNLFKENPSDHPIIFLRDVHFWEIESIMDFIYNGQVNVMQDQLPGFIRTAEALQIKGLAAVNNNNSLTNNNNIISSKMYHLKHMQEMLLRQPDQIKSTKVRPPIHINSFSDATKIMPPLVHPSKRFRPESNYISPHVPYKEFMSPISPHHSPNRFHNNNNMKDMNGDTSIDLSKKDSNHSDEPQDLRDNKSKMINGNGINVLADENEDRAAIHPIEIKREHPDPEKIGPPVLENGKCFESIPKCFENNGKCPENSGRFSENNGRCPENNGSLMGSPIHDSRIDVEEEWNGHETLQSDAFRDDWNGEQPSPMSISVNEAGLPICKVCGKVFKHQGSLVAHYQVHQQRTKCPVCKKVLSRHYHMKVHLLTVHKVPDSEIEGLLRSQNIT